MDKLEAIQRYIEGIYPVVRPAILLTPTGEAYNKGSDDKAYQIQRDLLAILGDDDADLG